MACIIALNSQNPLELFFELKSDSNNTLDEIKKEIETILNQKNKNKENKEDVHVVIYIPWINKFVENIEKRKINELIPATIQFSTVFYRQVQYRQFKQQVITLTGKDIFLNLNSFNTVLDIKKKIQDCEGIPPVQQRLIYKGQQLCDEEIVNNYNLDGSSPLELRLRLRGGGVPDAVTFADVSNYENIKSGVMCDNGPKWRTVQNGLNMEFKCKNRKCVAYNRQVISPMKYSYYQPIGPNIYKIDSKSLFKCPACTFPCPGETCGFYNCSWNITGKTSDGQVFGNEKEWKQSRGYDYFRTENETGQSSMRTFEYIIIRVDDLHYLNHQPYWDFGNECVICFKHLKQINKPIIELPCHHAFHANCFGDWKDVCEKEKIDISCPICRLVIDEKSVRILKL